MLIALRNKELNACIFVFIILSVFFVHIIVHIKNKEHYHYSQSTTLIQHKSIMSTHSSFISFHFNVITLKKNSGWLKNIKDLLNTCHSRRHANMVEKILLKYCLNNCIKHEPIVTLHYKLKLFNIL